MINQTKRQTGVCLLVLAAGILLPALWAHGLAQTLTPRQQHMLKELAALTVEDEGVRCSTSFRRSSWRGNLRGGTGRATVGNHVGFFSPVTLRVFPGAPEIEHRRYGGGRAENRIDKEHVVSVKEAWDSGLCAQPRQKRNFHNSLDNLVLMEGNINSAKGQRDPAEWLPVMRQREYHNSCAYVAQHIRVKSRWNLTVDARERDALRHEINRCPSFELERPGDAPSASAAPPAPEAVIPTPAPTPVQTPKPRENPQDAPPKPSPVDEKGERTPKAEDRTAAPTPQPKAPEGTPGTQGEGDMTEAEYQAYLRQEAKEKEQNPVGPGTCQFTVKDEVLDDFLIQEYRLTEYDADGDCYITCEEVWTLDGGERGSLMHHDLAGVWDHIADCKN